MSDPSPLPGKSWEQNNPREKLRKKILSLRKDLQEAEQAWIAGGEKDEIAATSLARLATTHKEMRRLKFITEHMAQLIWIIRSDGQPEYFNKRFFRYTGYTLRELKRSKWRQTIHPDDFEESLNLWQEALYYGEPCEIEYRLKKATDQTYRWHLVRSIPMKNDVGEITHWVSSATDIHERKQQSEQIEEKNHQLSRINQYLDDLVHATAHDLRVPVARLQLLVEAFQDLSSEQRKKVLPKIIRSVHNLDITLKGLIQVIELHSYPEELKQNIPLKEIIEYVLERKQDIIREAGAIIRIEEEESCTLNYVKSYLYTIIDNMISNAIKYRKPDQPLELNIKLKRQKEYCLMAFEDNGVGINLLKYREQLFLPFRRINKRVEGMGLGLYIIQTILEKNGGYIEVNSQPDKGSVFKIFLREYY